MQLHQHPPDGGRTLYRRGSVLYIRKSVCYPIKRIRISPQVYVQIFCVLLDSKDIVLVFKRTTIQSYLEHQVVQLSSTKEQYV